MTRVNRGGRRRAVINRSEHAQSAYTASYIAVEHDTRSKMLLRQVSSTATSNNNSQTVTGTVTMLQQLSSDSPTRPNDTKRPSTNTTLLTNAYQLIHSTTNTVHPRKDEIKIKRSLIFRTKEQHLYEVNCETNCDSQQIDS